MQTVASLSRSAKLFSFLLFAAALPAAAQSKLKINVGWLPITDEERQMKTPTIDPDAGVEALFWQVYVVDTVQGDHDIQRELYHYVRLKIFTDKGKDVASTIDIPFGNRTSILDVAGRTVKADGSITELKSGAVYERDVLRLGGIMRKVKSFALPGAEAGAIVEYQWREVRFNAPMLYLRLEMQREYPVHRVTYYIKPLPGDQTAYLMSLRAFNCKPSPLKLENDGYNSTSLENVPAFREEPLMPGEGSVRPWVLAY